ncbi:MAG: hypothetical protein K9N49_09165 [Candidatus Marinimicrobia bacterium]|nr:hypothetical protein [Candidatus Neomarinimicrobiota bacterium]
MKRIIATSGVKGMALILVGLALAGGVRSAEETRKEGDFADIMAAKQAAKHVQVWQRYPLIGIPLVDQAPVIDGQVNVREWAAAAQLGHLLHMAESKMVEDLTRFYLAYTETHLHIAFQLARPEAARQPGPQDVMELLFDVGHAHHRYYNLGLNLEKELWSGIGPNVDKNAWSPAFPYQARVTEFGWEGELSIPFSEIHGMTGAPAPGTLWGVDLVRNEKTPSDRLAHVAWRGNWHATKDLAHLLFTGAPLAVRVEGIGWMPEHKKMGIKLAVSNFGPAPVALDSRLTLRQAAREMPLGFLPALDSAFTEDLDAAIGAEMDQEVERALDAFPVVEQADEQVTIPAGVTRQIALTAPDEPGDYLAGFTLQRDGELLSAMTVPFVVTVPLNISLNSYLYSANKLMYQIDLRRVADQIGAEASVHVELCLGKDGPILASNRHEQIQGQEGLAGEFDVAPQSGATYYVRATVMDGEEPVAVNAQPLMLPEKPAWIGNALGRSKFVPPPWTPLQADAQGAQTLTIHYDWTGGLFPAIRVKDQEILAAPIELAFKDAAGNAAPLTLTSFALRSQDDERAEYVFAGEVQGIGRLEGVVAVEFDGFLWYDLTLTPTTQAGLSLCRFTAPLKNRYAKIFTRGRMPTGTHYPVPEGPDFGAVPDAPMVYPFTFQTWLGYLEGGLQWYCENARNWRNADPKQAIRVEKDEAATTLTVNFVDTPIALDGPLDWHFGLMPTPARTKLGGAEDHAYFQFTGTPPVEPDAALQATDPQEFAAQVERIQELATFGEKGVKAVILFSQYNDLFGYPGIKDAGKRERLRQFVPFMHAQGVKVLVYNGWGITTECDEWEEWGSELVNLPLKNAGYACYWNTPVSLYPDLFLYRMAEHIREFGLDGIYMDSTTGLNYSLHPNGMRWTDERGRPRGSFPVRAMRDFTKRIYKVLHGEVLEDGIYYNHHSPQANVCVENFADVRCPSEFAQFYEGAFDQAFIDYFLAKNGGIQYGYHAELTNKNWMKSMTKPLNELNALAVPLGVSFKAVTFAPWIAQDYSSMAQPMPKLWAAFAWLESEKAVHLPWWEDDAYIATAPTDGVLTAVWLRQGERALVSISNLPKEPRTIEVTLDLAAMGLPDAVAEDAIVGGAVPLDNGRMTIEIEGQRWRLIKLAPVGKP